MKNNFVIVIALSIAICFSSGCSRPSQEPNLTPNMIFISNFIDRLYYGPWWDQGSEVHVKLEIDSEFTGDAYLALYSSGKDYHPCTSYCIYDLAKSKFIKDSIVYNTVYYEPFRDSLKIEGFHIRSYIQYFAFLDYSNDALLVESPVDYPVYFKKIRVKKGKNREDLKIVFPRNLVEIPSGISFKIGVGRFNDEIKSRFEENFPGDYELSEQEKAHQNLYFETFPDSSKTSFVFTDFQLLRKFSFFPDEPKRMRPDDFRYGMIKGKFYFYSHGFNLNDYSTSPKLKCKECIIYR